jgi:hypothetical protein
MLSNVGIVHICRNWLCSLILSRYYCVLLSEICEGRMDPIRIEVAIRLSLHLALDLRSNKVEVAGGNVLEVEYQGLR